MPDFQYTARDRQGVAQSGAITAPSRSAAATQLRERGWIVLKVANVQQTRSSSSGDSVFGNLPPRSVHVEVSLHQLAMMLRSGMTLLASIKAVAEQAPRRSLGRVWQSISQELQRGQGLAETMEQHHCFPTFAVRLVQVGERTGSLATVLARAADTMKRRRTTQESFVSTIIYPVLVLLLSLFVTGYMIIYLIPRLETYLTSLGRQLPAITQSLIDGSFWLRDHYMTLVISLLVVIAGFMVTYASQEGRTLFDRILLRIPWLGGLMRLGETATFSRGLSMMLKSGITVTDGMLAVEKTLSNYHLRDAVGTGREKLIRGSSLVDSLNQTNTFTPLLNQMISVGEKSGDLATVLDEVALMSDQQFAASVKRLNAIVTPAMTLGIGAVVGYVYIAFFMALVAAGS